MMAANCEGVTVKIRNPFRKTIPTVEAPTLAIQHGDPKQALTELAGVFGDGLTANMVGSQFTCSEADKIARSLLLAGHRKEAETWLSGHAQGDEYDDYHFIVNDEDPEDEGRPLNDGEIADYVRDLRPAPSVAELVELIGL